MRKLLIMRGLPGSGKSTIVRLMATLFGEIQPVICSADDYFVNQYGQYIFDKSKLGEAHAQCKEEVEDAMKCDSPWIIVDNTNTTYQEIKPYLIMAEDNGYEVDFQEADTDLSVEECFKRNTHGVPLETIQRMKDRYESNEVVWEKWKRRNEVKVK